MVKKVIHYFNLNSYKKVNFMVAFIAFTITYFVENIIKEFTYSCFMVAP